MTLNLLANIVMVLGSITGMYYIAHRKKVGFVIFLFTEIALAFLGYTSHNHGLIITALVYLLMNIYSYQTWRKHEKVHNTNGVVRVG